MISFAVNCFVVVHVRCFCFQFLIMCYYMQMMVAYSSLFSSFIVERVGRRVGLSCLFGMLVVVSLSTAYARLVFHSYI